MADKYVTKAAWGFQYVLDDASDLYQKYVTYQGALASDTAHEFAGGGVKTIFPGGTTSDLGYRWGTSSGPDVTGPVLTSAVANGSSLTLTFNEVLSGSDFTGITMSGGHSLSGFAIASNQITATVSPALSVGESVTVSIADGGAITDAAANPVQEVVSQAVTNNTADTTAPSITAAEVDGTALEMTFSESLVGSNFSAITLDGGFSLSGQSISTNTITATVTPAVVSSDVITLDIAGGGGITDAALNPIAAESNYAVTNNTAPAGFGLIASYDFTNMSDTSFGAAGTTTGSGGALIDVSGNAARIEGGGGGNGRLTLYNGNGVGLDFRRPNGEAYAHAAIEVEMVMAEQSPTSQNLEFCFGYEDSPNELEHYYQRLGFAPGTGSKFVTLRRSPATAIYTPSFANDMGAEFLFRSERLTAGPTTWSWAVQSPPGTPLTSGTGANDNTAGWQHSGRMALRTAGTNGAYVKIKKLRFYGG